MPDFVLPRYIVRGGVTHELLDVLRRNVPGAVHIAPADVTIAALSGDAPYDFVAGMVSEDT